MGSMNRGGADVRGRTLFLAVICALSVLCATAVAGGQRVHGTKGADELQLGASNDRVHARAGDDTVDGGAGNDRIRGGHGDDALSGGDGDDRLRGGQDNDLLDGGDGDDHLNGGGDGRDKDRIACGDGYDVVKLGRGDVILVEAGSSSEDDCEEVKRPGGGREVCATSASKCDEPNPCAAERSSRCGPIEENPCIARMGASCDDPVVEEPEPDPPVEGQEPDEY
jgi:hypothetical protein